MIKKLLIASTCLLTANFALACGCVHVDFPTIHSTSLAVKKVHGILEMDYGNLVNNQCHYTKHRQEDDIVMKVNQTLKKGTKGKDIVNDAGKGFTCMRYTLIIQNHKAVDAFKLINKGKKGKYFSSEPFASYMDINLD